MLLHVLLPQQMLFSRIPGRAVAPVAGWQYTNSWQGSCDQAINSLVAGLSLLLPSDVLTTGRAVSCGWEILTSSRGLWLSWLDDTLSWQVCGSRERTKHWDGWYPRWIWCHYRYIATCHLEADCVGWQQQCLSYMLRPHGPMSPLKQFFLSHALTVGKVFSLLKNHVWREVLFLVINGSKLCLVVGDLCLGCRSRRSTIPLLFLHLLHHSFLTRERRWQDVTFVARGPQQVSHVVLDCWQRYQYQ